MYSVGERLQRGSVFLQAASGIGVTIYKIQELQVAPKNCDTASNVVQGYARRPLGPQASITCPKASAKATLQMSIKPQTTQQPQSACNEQQNPQKNGTVGKWNRTSNDLDQQHIAEEEVGGSGGGGAGGTAQKLPRASGILDNYTEILYDIFTRSTRPKMGRKLRELGTERGEAKA